jgi:general secretion pathway protein D
VLVEAVLAEVSIDTQRELGIELAGGDTNTAILGSLLPPTIGGGLLELANGGPPGPGLTVGAGDLEGDTQFAILLRALQGDGNTNVLSTPTLVTLDNEEASIVVGQNVPFITGQFTGTGTTIPENPFQTIERQDVGLTLKVKPQINEGDAIQLEITTEVSSVTSETIASDIITNKREIKTNVLVTDGQVVVLGGLISDEVTESVRKVPGLGDIPGFGELFKSRQAKKTKRNLMVFIHPIILKEDLTYRYTQGKYRYMRSQQELARERAPFKSMPYPAQIMPPLEDVQQPPGLKGERPIYPGGADSPNPSPEPEVRSPEADKVAEHNTPAAEPEPNQREWWEPDY